MSRTQREPKCIDLLSSEDKEGYIALRNYIASHCQNAESFKDCLKKIQKYVYRNDENCSKRIEACGMIWLDDKIGVCNYQLSYLFSKSKSKLKKWFKLAGYRTLRFSPDEDENTHQSLLCSGLKISFKNWIFWRLPAMNTNNHINSISNLMNSDNDETETELLATYFIDFEDIYQQCNVNVNCCNF